MSPYSAVEDDRRRTRKTIDPLGYMGVYKELADVPDRYRLTQFSAAFDGRDVWQEYYDQKLSNELSSDSSERRYRLTSESWNEHMDEQGRHHALAKPADVDSWVEVLLDEYTIKTATGNYWRKLNGFYEWLMWHPEYPHVYNPVWMAAAKDGATRKVWNEQMRSSRGEARE